MIKLSVCVLDTSAILAYIQNEPGAERVAFILAEATADQCRVFISFATLSEVYYIVAQKLGIVPARATVALLKEWPIEVVHSSERVALAAGRLKAAHRLSFADAFVAATAIEKDATLVHKDPEFEPLATIVLLEALPYKVRS